MSRNKMEFKNKTQAIPIQGRMEEASLHTFSHWNLESSQESSFERDNDILIIL